MNTRLVSLPAVFVLAILGAFVQTDGQSSSALAVDWKASLKAGRATLRLVLHITLAPFGFSASLDSDDQSGLGLPEDSARLNPTHLAYLQETGDYLLQSISKLTLAKRTYQQDPSFQPHGTLSSPAEGADRFSKVRGQTIEVSAPCNPAHTARHTAQIEEVIASPPGYPK